MYIHMYIVVIDMEFSFLLGYIMILGYLNKLKVQINVY